MNKQQNTYTYTYKHSKEMIKYFIATDKYNLLIEDENVIIYTIKKLWYRLQGYHNIKNILYK